MVSPDPALTWQEKLDTVRAFLADRGLNMLAVLDTATLATPAQHPPAQHQARKAAIKFSIYPRMLLLGNSGTGLWQQVQKNGRSTADPIDTYSITVITELFRQHLAGNKMRLLYPGPETLSLQQLGAQAGWHYPSPLGLGIHPQYGLWFAYRAVALTDAMLPVSKTNPAPHPCQSCDAKPCQNACPAAAIAASRSFDISACAGERLTPQSDCQSRCAARLACPVGTDYRQSQEQIAYHSQHSLSGLRRWAKQQ